MIKTKLSVRIASIELMRVISMLAIVIIHTGLFMQTPLFNGVPELGYLANQLSRFAVPFFFLVAGYFVQPKLADQPALTVKKYVSPLLKIWLLWSFIYLVLPFNASFMASDGYLAERMGYWNFLMQAPLNSLFEGGLVHLWFVPSLALAVAIIGLFVHFNYRYLLLPMAILVYGYGVLAGSYASVTEWPAPFLTRNGPFFSLLLVTIGYVIRERSYRQQTVVAVMLVVLGMIGHLVEAYWLSLQGVLFSSHDFLFFTPLWGVGILMLCLNFPNLGNSPVVFHLSKLTFGFYLAHFALVIAFINLCEALEFTGILRDAVVYFGVVSGTLIVVKAIQKSPLNRYLLR